MTRRAEPALPAHTAAGIHAPLLPVQRLPCYRARVTGSVPPARLPPACLQVQHAERTVREIATLNQMFSTAIMQQSEQIEQLYSQAVEVRAWEGRQGGRACALGCKWGAAALRHGHHPWRLTPPAPGPCTPVLPAGHAVHRASQCAAGQGGTHQPDVTQVHDPVLCARLTPAAAPGLVALVGSSRTALGLARFHVVRFWQRREWVGRRAEGSRSEQRKGWQGLRGN